jgi:hypothetical protein
MVQECTSILYYIIHKLPILLNLHSHTVYCILLGWMCIYIYISPSLHGTTAPNGPGPPQCQGFRICYTHHTRYNSLDKWSAQRTDLYLTTHNTHKRQASMPLAAVTPHTSDHAAIRISTECKYDVHDQIILINESIHKNYKPMHIKFCLLLCQLKRSKHAQWHSLSLCEIYIS